eukprot:s1424_g3.t1
MAAAAGFLRWCNSHQQLADGMTKTSARLKLAMELKRRMHSLLYDPQGVASKKVKKEDKQDEQDMLDKAAKEYENQKRIQDGIYTLNDLDEDQLEECKLCLLPGCGLKAEDGKKYCSKRHYHAHQHKKKQKEKNSEDAEIPEGLVWGMTLASQVLPAEGYLINSIVDYIPSEFIMAVKFHQIFGFVLALVFGLIFAYHIGKRFGRQTTVSTEVEGSAHEIQELLNRIESLEGICRIQKEEFEEALNEKSDRIRERDHKIRELGMDLDEITYKLEEMIENRDEQKRSYERELETAENAMVVWRDTAATSAHEANAAQLERDHYRRRARTLQNWPCYYTRHGDRWHLYQDCQALNQSEPMCKDMLCRFCGQRLMAETGNLAV